MLASVRIVNEAPPYSHLALHEERTTHSIGEGSRPRFPTVDCDRSTESLKFHQPDVRNDAKSDIKQLRYRFPVPKNRNPGDKTHPSKSVE
ncbi:hypothetical protein NPIL_247941 [Nephila pilipes]|uniref:Uncharacterized protein n=1 Tax=Nephila pilipes TaxID=299642 RepID=A0A8X6N6H8_NEPPI|nr:hypothetical protein NPIL_247941 [Nephila pilipes]